MKKKILLPGILILLTTHIFSQEQPLRVWGNPNALYFNHELYHKESLLSLALKYYLSPNYIATFNNLTLSSPLKKGQIIKIPLSSKNYNQTGFSADRKEKLRPLFKHFEKEESMINVIYEYNLHDSLIRKWNPQIKYEIPAKTDLLIGFIKIKQ